MGEFLDTIQFEGINFQKILQAWHRVNCHINSPHQTNTKKKKKTVHAVLYMTGDNEHKPHQNFTKRTTILDGNGDTVSRKPWNFNRSFLEKNVLLLNKKKTYLLYPNCFFGSLYIYIYIYIYIYSVCVCVWERERERYIERYIDKEREEERERERESDRVRDAHAALVIIVRNRHGDPSANSGSGNGPFTRG